jgi:hypothetical protein
MRRDVFQAIADPIRRAILGLLAAQKLTLNGVAENFKIPRKPSIRITKRGIYNAEDFTVPVV